MISAILCVVAVMIILFNIVPIMTFVLYTLGYVLWALLNVAVVVGICWLAIIIIVKLCSVTKKAINK